MKNFMSGLVLASLSLTLGLDWLLNSNLNRRPSSNEEFELQVQSLNFASSTRLHSLDKIYLRATFNGQFVYEFSKESPVSVARGENKVLGYSLPVNPEWLKNDQLEFKIEIVEKATFENVILRCATISKEISQYNRSYQCRIPGEEAPLLTYRIGKKGSVPGQLAANGK
jgi:hypothetical protein